MTDKGYWIECIPVHSNTNENFLPDLYSASIDSFPDMSVTAASPDMAVQKLREKLRKIKNYYAMTGRTLPEAHNPMTPTGRHRAVRGWMSVYMNVEEA
ncbi:MAG: hypothetical protein AB7E85_00625 [Pseudobdellovibrionaceae bacterium]